MLDDYKINVHYKDVSGMFGSFRFYILVSVASEKGRSVFIYDRVCVCVCMGVCGVCIY